MVGKKSIPKTFAEDFMRAPDKVKEMFAEKISEYVYNRDTQSVLILTESSMTM